MPQNNSQRNKTNTAIYQTTLSKRANKKPQEKNVPDQNNLTNKKTQ